MLLICYLSHQLLGKLYVMPAFITLQTLWSIDNKDIWYFYSIFFKIKKISHFYLIVFGLCKVGIVISIFTGEETEVTNKIVNPFASLH